MPSIASRIWLIASVIPTKEPSAFCRCSPNWSIAAAASFGGDASRDIVDLRLVPIVEASIPLLLIMAMAVDNSSMFTPSAAAGAPAYCIASPKSAIPNLDTLAAICTTSATCCVFSATSPVFKFHMFNALVMTSDVVAISSPDATDASIMPGIAAIVCSASNPPAANRSIASAASLAVIGKSCPNFRAVSFIRSNCSPVAPAFTPAPVMVSSKSIKVLVPRAPKADTAVAAGIIVEAMLPNPRPTFRTSLPNCRLRREFSSMLLRIRRNGSLTRSVNCITTSIMLAIFSLP